MRGRKKIDLTGQKFGRLVVVGDSEKRSARGHVLWSCHCDCGNDVVVRADNLLKGGTKSCGCYQKEMGILHGKVIKHGHSAKATRSRTYVTWQTMKARCLNEKSTSYKNYGGRGITVCDRWLHSFENFLEDMGVRPDDTSIDRINNDGNYEKGNCRWATAKEQAYNRRPKACCT